MKIAILLAMIFMHIFEDYFIQVSLARLKQKKTWEEDPIGSKPLYKHDYIIALIEHGFENVFMMMLPIMIYEKFNIDLGFILLFITNTIAHSIVDHEKCNEYKINLIQDQCVHLACIIITWIVLVL